MLKDLKEKIGMIMDEYSDRVDSILMTFPPEYRPERLREGDEEDEEE